MKIIKVKISDEEIDAFAAKKMPHVKKAIASAKSVLSIFEKEYPGDKRPRKAIEAAEAWVMNPTTSNMKKAAAAFAKASVASATSDTSDAASSAAYAAAAARSSSVAAAESYAKASVAAARTASANAKR